MYMCMWVGVVQWKVHNNDTSDQWLLILCAIPDTHDCKLHVRLNFGAMTTYLIAPTIVSHYHSTSGSTVPRPYFIINFLIESTYFTEAQMFA